MEKVILMMMLLAVEAQGQSITSSSEQQYVEYAIIMDSVENIVEDCCYTLSPVDQLNEKRIVGFLCWKDSQDLMKDQTNPYVLTRKNNLYYPHKATCKARYEVYDVLEPIKWHPCEK